jgi:hypothetical protein
MMQSARHVFLLLFLAPSAIALLVVVLSQAGFVSFQPARREMVEVSFDMAARSLLVIAILREIRWSYWATATYLVLFILHAMIYASVSNFSAVDSASLGTLLLISGTTLRYLHRAGKVPVPPRGNIKLGMIVQAAGMFLIVAAVWGEIVGAFAVLLVFGCDYILKRMR